MSRLSIFVAILVVFVVVGVQGRSIGKGKKYNPRPIPPQDIVETFDKKPRSLEDKDQVEGIQSAILKELERKEKEEEEEEKEGEKEGEKDEEGELEAVEAEVEGEMESLFHPDEKTQELEQDTVNAFGDVVNEVGSLGDQLGDFLGAFFGRILGLVCEADENVAKLAKAAPNEAVKTFTLASLKSLKSMLKDVGLLVGAFDSAPESGKASGEASGEASGKASGKASASDSSSAQLSVATRQFFSGHSLASLSSLGEKLHKSFSKLDELLSSYLSWEGHQLDAFLKELNEWIAEVEKTDAATVKEHFLKTMEEWEC